MATSPISDPSNATDLPCNSTAPSTAPEIMLETSSSAAPLQHRSTPTATVIVEPGHVETANVDPPAVGSDEIRIRVEGCGVCPSCLPAFEQTGWSPFPLAPGALGHESWGTVRSVGPDVERFRPGDRVASFGGAAFATEAIVDARSAVLLPPDLDGEPFPAAALARATVAMQRADLAAGDEVAIVADGLTGAYASRLATDRCARVSVLSPRPYLLQKARNDGADETFLIGETWNRTDDAIVDWNEERRFDCVIEATGRETPRGLPTDLCRTGGRLVVAGPLRDQPAPVELEGWARHAVDLVDARECSQPRRVRAMQETVGAAVDEGLEPFDLFTHQYPLADLEEALRVASTAPPGFLKAIVTARP